VSTVWVAEQFDLRLLRLFFLDAQAASARLAAMARPLVMQLDCHFLSYSKTAWVA